MPEPLNAALTDLRPLLVDAAGLVKAVASGRRRVGAPAHVRAELRTVELKAGRRVQLVTTDGRTPTTTNLEPEALAAAVDTLLAEPFGSWHVETLTQVVQLRVTKRGEAQVHHEHRDADAVTATLTAHDRPKQHLIDPADPLFTVLGADAAKRRQVDAFLRQLAPIARRLAVTGDPLRVVDLGCGNAYLTMAAHRYLVQHVDPRARTLGIDLRPEMAARNTDLAGKLGLSGLAFVAGSIEDAAGRGEPIDLALALHACDTATDDALTLAVRGRARAILAAPCCHHDVQRQLEQNQRQPEPDQNQPDQNQPEPDQNQRRPEPSPTRAPLPFAALTRHAILRERFADVLTDAVRADLLRLLGYRVEVVEFIDSRHTPRNALIRAVLTGAAPTARRIAEYTDLVTGWQLRPALADRLDAELSVVLAGVK